MNMAMAFSYSSITVPLLILARFSHLLFKVIFRLVLSGLISRSRESCLNPFTLSPQKNPAFITKSFQINSKTKKKQTKKTNKKKSQKKSVCPLHCYLKSSHASKFLKLVQYSRVLTCNICAIGYKIAKVDSFAAKIGFKLAVVWEASKK
jgi:hypothetical protein